MYSKQEAARLKEEFWTSFGRYMSPILSAEGEKINWINYKTGEKQIHFKMQADSKSAIIYIEISHADPLVQQLYFQKFQATKSMLQLSLAEEWDWQLHTTDDSGRTTSKISKELKNVNVFDKECWPALISFFKPRIIALDNFWSTARYAFEALK